MTSIPLWKISFPIEEAYAQFFSESIEEFVLATSCFEQPDNPFWLVEGVTNGIDQHESIKDFVSTLAENMGLPTPTITIQPIPETDWLEATWKSFPPRTIGRFYIYGTHNTETPPQDKIGIKINAATAFGSGEHETTTGCLMAIDQLAKQGSTFMNPLDMGCGSGILAIATAKVWGVSTLAVDNDPEAVRVAVINAEQNQCDTLVHGLVSEGFESDAVRSRGPFDLITANILAKPLIEMAPQMKAALIEGGKIVLSGILTRQQDDVIEAYLAVGFTLQEIVTYGDWVALIFHL